ncbi:hypothetical protein ACLKA6_003340 [Drosophila palustris]
MAAPRTKSRLRPGRRGPHTDRRPSIPRPPPTRRDSQELQRKQNHHKQSCNAGSIATLAEPPRATTKLQPSSAATRTGSATSWLCRHERGQNFKRANSAPRVRAAATS